MKVLSFEVKKPAHTRDARVCLAEAAAALCGAGACFPSQAKSKNTGSDKATRREMCGKRHGG
jgi:hypothetical protein